MDAKSSHFDTHKEMQNKVGVNELSGVPLDDQARIIEIARNIYPLVASWSEQFPALLTRRLPSTCLACAAMCPDASQEVIVNICKFSMLAWVLDDVTDNVIGSQTNEQIEEFITLYSHIVASGGEPYTNFSHLIKQSSITENNPQPWLQVAQVLSIISKDLSIYPQAPSYYAFYQKRFGLLMESMRQELVWSQELAQQGIYPEYKQYLENGQESASSPTILAALLVMVGGIPSVEAEVMSGKEELEKLFDAITLSSGAIIRLANDIRSFERDRLEPKPNAISIQMTISPGLSEKDVEASILIEINAQVKELKTLINSLPSGLSAWGNSAVRLAEFAKDYYLVREFHNFTLEMLSQLSKP